MAKKKKHKGRRFGMRNASAAVPRSRARTASADPRAPLKPWQTALAVGGIGLGATWLSKYLVEKEGVPLMLLAPVVGAAGLASALLDAGGNTWIGSAGLGAMTASAAVLLLAGEPSNSNKPEQVASADDKKADDKKPANSLDALPPGSLERAMGRAKARLALGEQFAG